MTIGKDIRKGMTVVINPRITVDPYGMRGEKVKVMQVRRGYAMVVHKNKKGFYDVDTLDRVKKK